ncbi:PAS domain S-box protein [Rhodobacterales bacterium HKCCSP123]|nr:PAS domain S-box protein [Rhodobacterales bacterium HKCCSP123]
MTNLSKKRLAALVFGNATIAFALTLLLMRWVPLIEDTNSIVFISLYAVIAAFAALLSVLAVRAALNPHAAASIKRLDDAVDLREGALNEHTIVSITDLEGRILKVNQNFVDAFGHAPEEIEGRTVDLLYRDDDDTFEPVKTAIGNGAVWRGRQNLRTKAGDAIQVQTTILPRYDARGRMVDTISVRTDLTKALAEGAVQGRNAVVEALPDEVYIYDAATFRLKYLNRKARTRLRVGHDAVREICLLDLFSEPELLQYRSHVAPVLSGEVEVARIEIDHVTGPVEILTHISEDFSSGRTLVSVVRDISARKQAEQLKLSSVSTVSHELRTPLTSIRGALRLLESGVLGELSPDAARTVAVASRNSERLVAIVNDILVLQKLSSGELTVDLRPDDLRELLKEAAEANAGYAAQCDVEIAVEPSPWPAMALVDPDRMMQVMANLLSNAAKFSAEGSTVVLRLRDRDASWRIEVQDAGPGIPKEAQATIFDSFTQAANVNPKGHPGTGLGLTICKKIVEQHHGSIGFETDPKRGTTFYIELGKAEATGETRHIA